jgi:hypothetical protein
MLDCRPFRALAQFRCVAKENRTAAAHHTLHRLCTQVPVFMVWDENPKRWSVLQWWSGLEDPRSKRTR